VVNPLFTSFIIHQDLFYRDQKAKNKMMLQELNSQFNSNQMTPVDWFFNTCAECKIIEVLVIFYSCLPEHKHISR